ncbi:unnamed protein product [Arabis nemorensis]|uniref:F-box domain-containing protein n=1 Tax=Arabis nemorensis TaxID=586526 RepID=A0A565CEP6_9BRAS|nr:unnamed protein product [Arabis nemorensis]
MASLPLPCEELPSPESDRCGSPCRSGPKRNHQCLPLDIMRLVFERLGFADLERAKCVCSSWQSASKQSKPNNQIPWMILFPKDKNYCLLFNPEEKDKVYKTQDLSNDFGKSFCVATYRSWLLMQPQKDSMEDCQYNLYILDLLTLERINLPTFESEYGLPSSILWIDEKTKDYIVIGMVDEEDAVVFKKGDNSWKQMPQLSGIEGCFNMVYKNHKLYCLNNLSGLRMRPPGTLPDEVSFAHSKNNVVVTVGGDILIVTSLCQYMSKIWKFRIYKMDSSKGNKWEEIFSLGDEAILLDLGITVIAKDIEGIKGNSIYFKGNAFEGGYDENDIFIFNIDTKKVEQPHQFVCSSVPCYDARWFLPSFKRE